jgi:Fur family ferric uptake transcriptional regulator
MAQIRNPAIKMAGLKVTAPRTKILEIFETSGKRHLSAEEIYRKLVKAGEDIGIATIYRVLTQFESAGILTRHHFSENHSIFELDSGEHHDHLVCVKCGHVEEFVDSIIEERQKEIARKAGYQMSDHALHIYGLCPQCQEKITENT